MAIPPSNLDLRISFLRGKGTDDVVAKRLQWVNQQLGPVSSERGGGSGTGISPQSGETQGGTSRDHAGGPSGPDA